MEECLRKTYTAEIAKLERERQKLLERKLRGVATPGEEVRYRSLEWKIESVRARLDDKKRSAYATPAIHINY